ncbi:MAG: sugar phosphate isomerase/epimerase [Eubacteriaceae bacterium]|nr:sugar phosphate isomerase/epimerase [Eubacteriaceae bacterium]
MKKSIFSWFGYYIPLPERLRLISDAGFHGASLWWEDEIWPDLIEKEKMPHVVRETGLFLENIHTPYKDVNELWSPQESIRDNVVKRYKNYLDECSHFEIPIMVMHCTDENSEENVIAAGLESFNDLARYAEKSGVKIAIENTRDGHIVDRLLEEFNSPFLGMCYDSSHDWLENQSKGELLLKWHKRLFTTHLSDNDLKGDRHWIPGDGEVDFLLIAKLLEKSDLEYIHMELASSAMKIEDPAEFLSIAMNRIDGIIGKNIE